MIAKLRAQPRVTQADIVENKRLSAVLTQIQQDQQVRDDELLARSTRTLRQKYCTVTDVRPPGG